ncbi:MAG: PEP-CTERM sorting domain-containing protein, partial [Phycisphaerae bacterium]|nr:PEP-CTERM sorting domain-containing protein [Phycisphaerae bacterium]
NISALGSSLLDQTYTLLSVANGGLSLSDFAFSNNLTTESLLVGSNSYNLALSIAGVNNNDLVLTVSQSSIPEPATLGLMSLGGLALLLVKRRQRA